MVEIVKSGKVVSRSRNLRGLLAYARKAFPWQVVVSRCEGGASVYIIFDDGAECRTKFADYSVAREWFKARRSWALTMIDGANRVEFYIPTSDARAAIR